MFTSPLFYFFLGLSCGAITLSYMALGISDTFQKIGTLAWLIAGPLIFTSFWLTLKNGPAWLRVLSLLLFIAWLAMTIFTIWFLNVVGPAFIAG